MAIQLPPNYRYKNVEDLLLENVLPQNVYCTKISVSLYHIVWCMKFKKALNKEKNTPINRKDENGVKLKLIITSFNIRLLTLRKIVAS